MIKGFAAKKTPPESIEPKVEPIPCPKCGQPVGTFPPENVENEGLDPDDVTLLGCGTCKIVAAHVERVVDVWRACTKPEDLDVVIQDAHDALRHRHFMTSDANDPMWAAF